MYKSDKKGYGSSGHNAGTVSAHSEQTVKCAPGGGKKYSTNNPKDLDRKSESLAKVPNK